MLAFVSGWGILLLQLCKYRIPFLPPSLLQGTAYPCHIAQKAQRMCVTKASFLLLAHLPLLSEKRDLTIFVRHLICPD